jgi:PPP family 3-phenylpropionic acid transporter
MLAFAGTALLLPAVPVRRDQDTGGALGEMMRRPPWILFIAVVFLCWIASNASILFMGVALSAMGAGQALIGVAVTVGAVVEIPFMAYSGRLLRRFGPIRLLWTAMLLMVARYFLLGWMPAPGWAIGINLLNGLSFPLFWNSSVTYANRMAPPGLAGTAQGLLNFASGFAGVVSALLTGWLFDRVGPNGLFIVMAFIVLLALGLWSAGQLRRRRDRF